MQSKTGFWVIFKREWLRILNSKICIWGMLVAPLLSLVLLVWMMDSGLPTKIPIGVVDLDNSKTSRGLIRQLDAFPKTDIKFKHLNFTEARQAMERMDIYAILTIPRDFSKDAMSGNQPKLVYYTNNSFLVTGSLMFQDLKTVSTLAAASVGLQMGTAKGYSEVQIMPIVQPIVIKPHPQGNPWLNYSIYLNNLILPGILLLIVQMFTVSAFGSEIKAGTGQDLLRLGNNSMLKVLAAKLLPYTISFMFVALIIMSVLFYYNSFPLRNGFLPMFFAYLFLIMAGQAIGIIVTAIIKNYRLAASIASLVGVVSFSITGFSFPVLAMDGSLQAIANLFPLRHFFLIYLDQGLNGWDIGYSAERYAILLIFVLVGIIFSFSVKKELNKNYYEG